MDALETKIGFLLEIAYKEKNELEFLLTGVDRQCEPQKHDLMQIVAETARLNRMLKKLPDRTLAAKEDMEELLQKIKKPFYELAGISPVNDPELVVLRNKRYMRAAQTAHRLTKKFRQCSAVTALLSAVDSAPALGLFGLGLYGLLFLGAYAYAFSAIKRAGAFTMDTKVSDSIFLPPSPGRLEAFMLAHEYAHNVRHKLGLYTTNDIMEEGIATATAHKVLGLMKMTDPIYSAFAAVSNIYCLSAACTALLRQSGANVAMPKFILKLLEGKLSFYSVGSSAVHLAEYKYGEGIYKELFAGKYDCLLD